ncbi:MAG TPA: hypothetical protein VIJ79_15295 [Acidobacteriaceae bacterium]
MNAEIGKLVSGDTVEVIATGRKGSITFGVGSALVSFFDGKEPKLLPFSNLNDLRLIENRVNTPALIPEQWIV